MANLKCQCGKLICQVEGGSIIIKCRHCKRFIVIRTSGLLQVEIRGDEHSWALGGQGAAGGADIAAPVAMGRQGMVKLSG